MRFTVTATNPQTGLVEVVYVNAADATAAAWIVAASGAEVQRVEVAPEQHADEWEPVRQEARQWILWARGFACLLGGLMALAGAGLAIFVAPFQLSAGLVALGITIGPAVALLLLARQASRLGQGAIVSLMTLAGLMTTGVAFIAVLFPNGPIVFVLAFAAPSGVGIIYNCARALNTLSRIRRGQPTGFLVESAKPLQSVDRR